MTDFGVMFSPPMISGLLYDRKTQTRRPSSNRLATAKPGDRIWVRESCRAVEDEAGDDHVEYLAGGARRPIANTLEAAERWSRMFHYRKKDGARPAGMIGDTLPAIHMPRWASRMTLLIREVRIERLQDIDGIDAEAEGVEYESADPPFWYVPGIMPHSLTGVEIREGAAASYRKLWDHINGPGSWDANPEVVAISFRVILANIDA